MLYNKYNFQIAKNFTRKERAELSGIFITPSETVATDGFKMIRVERVKQDIEDYPISPDGKKPLRQFKPFILPQKVALKLAKELSEKRDLPILENAVVSQRKDNLVELSYADLESFYGIKAKPIEEKYPEYQDIKMEGRYKKILLNVDYLEQVVSFYKDFMPKNSDRAIEIYFPLEGEKPLWFRGKREEQTARAVLMPIKEG